MLYLTNDLGLLPFFLPLGLIGFYRYLWYAIKLLAWGIYRPVRPSENPTYTSYKDVTIIVPTIDAGDEFKIAARSWLACRPKEIIIVTETKMRKALEELANEVDPGRIRVRTVPRANKRLQMIEGINATTTEILVFADDDAIWKPTMLDYILCCFEDLKMGGVGTSQKVHAINLNGHQTVWEVLAGFRLTIRNIEVAASTHIDGGVCCLSGRTAAYRTLILKDPAFQYGFQNDLWLGKWMVSHGWNTHIQVTPEAELSSTFKDNWHFLKQVLRWTRNTWRSDFRSLFTERYIWYRYPYVAFTMLDKMLNPFTLLSGPILVAVFSSGQKDQPNALPGWNIAISYILWLLLTRTVKLLPHFLKRPQDIIWIPAWLAFNYYFAIMKIYALFTLHEVGWGTRAGVATGLAADIAKEKDNSIEPSSSSDSSDTVQIPMTHLDGRDDYSDRPYPHHRLSLSLPDDFDYAMSPQEQQRPPYPENEPRPDSIDLGTDGRALPYSNDFSRPRIPIYQQWTS